MNSGPNKIVEISASLLAADYARLGDEVQCADRAGVNSFHFDMMDGHYVPNLALAPDHLKALRPYSRLPFYVHLELDNPDQVITSFITIQADVIIVQWNTLKDPARTFKSIRSQGMKVGLGFNPGELPDPASSFFPELDLLLLLGVYPGFGGQVIQSGMQERVRAARQLLDRMGRHIPIAVDGGVKPDNAASLVQAGAGLLIMGTALFQSEDITETVKSVRGSIEQAMSR